MRLTLPPSPPSRPPRSSFHPRCLTSCFPVELCGSFSSVYCPLFSRNLPRLLYLPVFCVCVFAFVAVLGVCASVSLVFLVIIMSPGRQTEFRTVVTGLPQSASWQDLKDHMRKVSK